MFISYMINGQEMTYYPDEVDVGKTRRALNDGWGIPAEPMCEVVTLAASICGMSPVEFVRDVIFEFIDEDEFFDMEPILFFNNVLAQHLFDDDTEAEIIDIIFEEDF